MGAVQGGCRELEIVFIFFIMISRVARQELPEATNPTEISR